MKSITYRINLKYKYIAEQKITPDLKISKLLVKSRTYRLFCEDKGQKCPSIINQNRRHILCRLGLIHEVSLFSVCL